MQEVFINDSTCSVGDSLWALRLQSFERSLHFNFLQVPGLLNEQYDAAILTQLFAAAQSPVFLHTPQNTGSHNLQFDYDQSLYTLSPLLAPGQTKLQIDATDAANPLISFVSPASPIGQSGAVTVCKSLFPLIYFSTAFVASGWGAICSEAMFSMNPSPALHWHPTWLCMP